MADCFLYLCAQARASIPETKKRIQESEKRIDTSLDGFVKKQYWCDAPIPSGLFLSLYPDSEA